MKTVMSDVSPLRFATRSRVWLAIATVALSITVARETAHSASATALSAFHTPAWLIQCYVVGEEQPPTLICSRLADGRSLTMGVRSTATLGRNSGDIGRHDPFAARRELAFGRYWAFGSAFGCVSRSTGLKCWNEAGHGWWLGR